MSLLGNDPKPFWQSKTFWMALATIVAPFAPPISALIVAHPEAVLTIVGLVNGGLRLVTDKPVALK